MARLERMHDENTLIKIDVGWDPQLLAPSGIYGWNDDSAISLNPSACDARLL